MGLLRLRTTLLTVLLMLHGAGAAFAMDCGVLFGAQNLEARISLLRETVPRGEPGTHIQPLLSQLFSGVAQIDASAFRDPDLAFSVRSYQSSIIDISRAEFEKPVAVSQLLVGSRHRTLLRRMILLANDACDDTSVDDSPFVENQAASMDWGTLGVIGSIVLIASGGALYFVARLSKRRAAQKQRHYCQIPVDIKLADTQFASVLFDISALGAKIKKHEPGELAGTVKLTFEKSQLSASVQWQNAHFFGVLFKESLSLRHVRGLIDEQPPPQHVPKAAT